MVKRKAYTLSQIVILMLLGAGLLLGTQMDCTCLGCTCTATGCKCTNGSNSSSSLGATLRDEPDAQAAGILTRWADFEPAQGTITDRTFAMARQLSAIPAFMGLLVPTAPGAAAPGRLPAAGHEIVLSYKVNNRSTNITVRLIPDATRAAQLAAVFPPPAGAQWQALVAENQNWVSNIPTQTATINLVGGWLKYTLDFQGASYCDGCEVPMTACAETELDGLERFALEQAGVPFVEADDLLCLPPASSNIELMTPAGRLQPGRLPFASFGAWGGVIFTSTMTSTVKVPLALEHNIYRTETFTLEPIASERGWSYAWQNLQATPIAQVNVVAPPSPLWNARPLNVVIAGRDLPTCVQMRDTIFITATHVTTPTLRATTAIQVLAVPDPARCTVADLGVRQIASAASVDAGQLITFTTTITNYTARAITAIVTETLEPAGALGALSLPAECQQVGAQVVCQFNGFTGPATRVFNLGVQTATRFGGTLSSQAEIQPAGGSDPLFLDNAAGPLEVTVNPPPLRYFLLPLIAR